ncbi:hypothetical protein EUGRSUZ_B03922 [Eucalyptus grandis]|uniref:Uncharacterized protein n=2 Tax=Eucalyptus grandis TaxID=71139 RepID=A0ACC3LZP9_EUCGR|nr:hypothetical protein EUGRSUZ_B03922 [Eucalyptus grandis]
MPVAVDSRNEERRITESGLCRRGESRAAVPVRVRVSSRRPVKIRSFHSSHNLNDPSTQYHCCIWSSSFCCCRLGISILHGVQVVSSESCDRCIKAAPTSGNFSRALHKHRVS